MCLYIYMHTESAVSSRAQRVVTHVGGIKVTLLLMFVRSRSRVFSLSLSLSSLSFHRIYRCSPHCWGNKTRECAGVEDGWLNGIKTRGGNVPRLWIAQRAERKYFIIPRDKTILSIYTHIPAQHRHITTLYSSHPLSSFFRVHTNFVSTHARTRGRGKRAIKRAIARPFIRCRRAKLEMWGRRGVQRRRREHPLLPVMSASYRVWDSVPTRDICDPSNSNCVWAAKLHVFSHSLTQSAPTPYVRT